MQAGGADEARVARLRIRLLHAQADTQRTTRGLRRQLSNATDWHVWFNEDPMLYLALSFLTGVLLASRR